MLRTVVLEHRLPDGDSHFDWMIERSGPGEDRRLITWRTECRPDLVLEFRGERIGDHRAAYLEFEGELSGGRGQVVRVASGRVSWLCQDEREVRVRVEWSGGANVRYAGAFGAGGAWTFCGSPE
jgi:hypothetical protein